MLLAVGFIIAAVILTTVISGFPKNTKIANSSATQPVFLETDYGGVVASQTNPPGNAVFTETRLLPTATIFLPSQTASPLEQQTKTPQPTIAVAANSPQFGWQQGKLAYIRQIGPRRDILVIDLLTGEESLVFWSDKSLMGLSWAPDAARLSFFEYNGDLIVLSLLPEPSPVRIADRCYHPSWSPDGTRIICKPTGSGVLSVYSANNRNLIDQITVGPGSNIPVWSPTNNEIAFALFEGNRTSIWRTSLESVNPVLLAGDGDENYAPAWSADGEHIAFQSRMTSQDSQIWVMGRNGETQTQITDSSNHNWARAPSWSPDGKWIAYVADVPGSGPDFGDAFIISLETGEIVQITNTFGAVYDWRVSWSN